MSFPVSSKHLSLLPWMGCGLARKSKWLIPLPSHVWVCLCSLRQLSTLLDTENHFPWSHQGRHLHFLQEWYCCLSQGNPSYTQPCGPLVVLLPLGVSLWLAEQEDSDFPGVKTETRRCAINVTHLEAHRTVIWTQTDLICLNLLGICFAYARAPHLLSLIRLG